MLLPRKCGNNCEWNQKQQQQKQQEEKDAIQKRKSINVNGAKLVRTRKLKQATAQAKNVGQQAEAKAAAGGRRSRKFQASLVCGWRCGMQCVWEGGALFSGIARAKLNFHQPFSFQNPTRFSAECLFTPQNFFNKHIRLTGQGSLRCGGVATGCPFFSLFIEKPLDYAGLSQHNPSIFCFCLASFFPVFYSIFFSPSLSVSLSLSPFSFSFQ